MQHAKDIELVERIRRGDQEAWAAFLALAERLGEYNAFEADMNQRYEYGSDCSVPVEPVLGYEAGRCVDLLQGSGAVSVRIG